MNAEFLNHIKLLSLSVTGWCCCNCSHGAITGLGGLLLHLLPGLAGHHAAPSHGLKQFLDLRGAVDKLVGPELEGRVLDQLDEGDEETPGVRSVDNQPLQQHPAIQ